MEKHREELLDREKRTVQLNKVVGFWRASQKNWKIRRRPDPTADGIYGGGQGKKRRTRKKRNSGKPARGARELAVKARTGGTRKRRLPGKKKTSANHWGDAAKSYAAAIRSRNTGNRTQALEITEARHIEPHEDHGRNPNEGRKAN